MDTGIVGGWKLVATARLFLAGFLGLQRRELRSRIGIGERQSSRGPWFGTRDPGHPGSFDKLRAGGAEGPSTPLRSARAERFPSQ
jgi:hypothetical protein